MTSDNRQSLHLSRLAQLSANITDAHSCFIFLPPTYLNRTYSSQDTLLVAGYHSLCNEVIPDCVLRKGTGLIGWVAEHKQPIHVSPFEHDSRTLGMYREDRQLKSFIGIPILLNNNTANKHAVGVLTCDSKKSFAFSKLQGKLLSDLAIEISVLVELLNEQAYSQPIKSWVNFIDQGMEIVKLLGSHAVDILRVRVNNFSELERQIGSSNSIDLVQQLLRLIQQSFPPNFAYFQLPNGDFLIILDNMLTAFYENKIVALAKHITPDDIDINLAFNKYSLKTRNLQLKDLEQAISHTAFVVDATTTAVQPKDNIYEYRRA